MSLGGSQHTGKYFFLIVGLHLISKAVFVWKQNKLEWNITIIKKLGFVSLVLKLIFLYFPVGSFMCCLPRQTNQPEGLLKKCFPGREDCYENWSLSLSTHPELNTKLHAVVNKSLVHATSFPANKIAISDYLSDRYCIYRYNIFG